MFHLFIILTSISSIFGQVDQCPIPPRPKTEISLIPQPTTSCNNKNGHIIQIPKESGGPLIRVCFNPKQHRTYWTQHYFHPYNGTCQGVKNTWKSDFFENLPINDLYHLYSMYVEKAQLTPLCDFKNPDDQSKTFYYINAAPQYWSLGRGKWDQLEREIRGFNEAVKVTTGTYGAACSIGKLSFPDLFFKIVTFTNNTNRVFVGVNTDKGVRDKICEFEGGSVVGEVYECDLKQPTERESVLMKLQLRDSDLEY